VGAARAPDATLGPELAEDMKLYAFEQLENAVSEARARQAAAAGSNVTVLSRSQLVIDVALYGLSLVESTASSALSLEKALQLLARASEFAAPWQRRCTHPRRAQQTVARDEGRRFEPGAPVGGGPTDYEPPSDINSRPSATCATSRPSRNC
jgi:hypothetical protein